MHKILYLIFALAGFVLDQLSKWYVTEHIVREIVQKPNELPLSFFEWLTSSYERFTFMSLEVWPFFNIVMVWNQGVSFGLLSSDSAITAIALSLLSLAITVIFTIWLFRSTSRFQCIAIALVISGAIGNVIDRVRFGAVIDFLDVHIAGYHWPAFNVADSAISIGVFLLIIHSFFIDDTGQEPPDDANT